jgi:hypothetical protein
MRWRAQPVSWQHTLPPADAAASGSLVVLRGPCRDGSSREWIKAGRPGRQRRERRSVKVGAIKIRTLEVGGVQVGTLQIGIAQVGVAQISRVQATVAKPGLAQIGPAKVGSWQAGRRQASQTKIGAAEAFSRPGRGAKHRDGRVPDGHRRHRLLPPPVVASTVSGAR